MCQGHEQGWIGARGKERGMVLLDPMHRFPGAYPAPLVFSTDIDLCWALWYTEICAESTEVWKGGADEGNADSTQAVHWYPAPPPPPAHPQTQSHWTPSFTQADHGQTIWCPPAISWHPETPLWPWYGCSSNCKADEGRGSVWEGHLEVISWGWDSAGGAPARALSACVSLLVSWRLDDLWYWNDMEP